MEDENFDTVPSYYRHSITGFGPITAPDQRNLFALFNGGNLSNADRLGFRFASVKLKRKRMDCDPSVACDTRESDSPLSPNFRFFQSRVNLVDRTGSFHWTPDVPYSKSTLTPSQAGEFQFNNHILVCVVGTPINGPLNLENFIMPLRFHWKQIHDIVILGNSQLIGQKEWDKLKNFPRIFIVHGDPCSFTDLYAVQLSKCNACVILGDTNEELDSQSVDICLQDRKTLLCAMNIRSLLQRERHLVHLTTELRYERNAHLFSSVDTHENDYKLPVWFNEPFARGFIFSNSLLYSCLSSFFYNEDVFHFLRVLISGEATDELETSFAVGAGNRGLQEGLPDQTYRMPGVNVALCGFDDPPFCFMANEKRRVSYLVTRLKRID
ncbi:Calcium-activated potassium channel subunit alpha-1 [Fasciolopsis buskii]|uniref:Calcium-activated potassium channel subunit alpha-1 n=1 Tax=Fasciolopsis buskii TaxID=27845 RepID=A0A8E0S7R4_9TREM|nr:Calcium-activated potassium channel subunit alpha-1 [Fasciolopsis buski]